MQTGDNGRGHKAKESQGTFKVSVQEVFSRETKIRAPLTLEQQPAQGQQCP